MIYKAKEGQVSSGEPIGILLLDTSVPFIPGDPANATTYDFPVRLQKLEGVTVERVMGKDKTVYPDIRDAAMSLVGQGVRAITANCGFTGLHQSALAAELNIPVFLSSLIQIPFITTLIGQNAKIAVMVSSAKALSNEILSAVGVNTTDNLVIGGLEDQPNFYDFALKETGTLDSEAVSAEIVNSVTHLVKQEPKIKAILLECGLFPPYSAAVQEAVGLPVFDYVTMIKYVFSAVVHRRPNGYM